MKKTYKHLNIQERERILELKWEGRSLTAIAKDTGRSPATISRELRRNGGQKIRKYSPSLAQTRAIKRRSSRGRNLRLKNEQIRSYVITKLKLGWSPEQISGRLSKYHPDQSISYEAIYQFIYARVSPASDLVYQQYEDLRPYLARKRKRRMKKGLRKPHKIRQDKLPSIETRPKEVEERATLGHWEDDSIVYTPTCPVRLRTANELASGVVFIDKAVASTMAEANRISKQRFSKLPKKLLKTLTRDRGPENMGYKELEADVGISCFFAHPYSSWERGANENLNGLVRRFLPKGTDFRELTDEQIKQIEYLLNTRPRKRLGYKTPYEVFYQLTGVALEC